MKKTLFVLGSVEALIGVILWSVTDLLKNIMPLLGRVVFQEAAAGSYSASDYVLNTSVPGTLAFVLIVVGIVQIILALIKKEK